MAHEEAREKIDAHICLRGGASLVDSKPEFSQDAKLLMCCSGHSIRVLSVASGECVHTLHGHTDRVTGVKLNPNNPFQLLSCSKDGHIIKWDYRDGVLVRKYGVGAAVHAMYTVTGADDNTIYAVRTVPKTSSSHELVSFSLPSKCQEITETRAVLPSVPPEEKQVDVSPRGEFAASIENDQLTVCNTSSLSTKVCQLDKKHYRKFGSLTLTCVACHPTEHCVATGLSDGMIVLWYNILRNKKVVQTVIHWHALSVRHLTFTSEGSYLLSGGHECVLVKWQWNSNYKEFLPRLKSTVIGISCSPDNSHYAICHADNGLQIISSSNELIQTFQGFTQAHLDHSGREGIISGLNLDPRSGLLVTNGKPGHLQFYDIYKDKQRFNLDIVSQNFTSPENIDKPHTVTKIECVAFSSTGDWLATVERWDDGRMTPEIRLKFWAYVPETQGYKLNTLVDMPHKDKVHDLKFRPTTEQEDDVPMAVTASSDGTFKIWALVDDTDIYRKNQCWACESVGFYRDEKPGAMAMCDDGTLLAVGFGTAITLWNPDNNELKHTLALHQTSGEIREVLFGSEVSSYYMMTSTSSRLYVWNLLTLAVSWSLPLVNCMLVKCPASNLFAVFTEERSLQLFTPRSSTPEWSETNVSPWPILAAVFMPRKQRRNAEQDENNLMLPWQHTAELFFMNSKHELLTVSSQAEETITTTVPVLKQNLPETPFSILLSDKKKMGKVTKGTDHDGTDVARSGEAFLDKMLSTPAHVLPPVSSLSMTFLNTLLKPLKSSDKTLQDDEDMDDSDGDIPQKDPLSDDSDSDMEISKSAPEQKEICVKSQGDGIDDDQLFIESRRLEYSKYQGKDDVTEMFSWLMKI